MKELILFSLFSFISTTAYSQSCYPLYEAKAAAIVKNAAEFGEVGRELVLMGSPVFVHPDISTPLSNPDNWAQDLVDGIKYGPDIIRMSFHDPKEAWLRSLYGVIKKECKLQDDKSMSTFREMLNELMEDGSFCPGGKILKSTLFKPRGHFKNVVKHAVKSGQFADRCSVNLIADDSYRAIKDVSTSGTKSKKQNKKKASKQ